MYLLDTNICIHLLNQADQNIQRQFKKHSPSQIALCSIVKAELLYGAQRSSRLDANLQRLKLFFMPLQSLAFDDLCAEHYAMIRTDLAAKGTPIGPNDLLIAPQLAPTMQCWSPAIWKNSIVSRGCNLKSGESIGLLMDDAESSSPQS